MKSILTLLSLLLVFSLPAVGQSYESAQISVEPYANKIERTGKLGFKRTLNLSFKSSGYLTQLSVDDGDYFEQGQLLATLEIAELTATKDVYYAQLLKAKRDVTRVTELKKQSLSSEQELDDAKTQVATTRAEFQAALYNLEKAQIIAPFDGIVIARNTELGELQSPAREILQVAALADNWIAKVALTEEEVSQVSLGQKVQVALHNIGVVDGVISKIPAMGNNQSNLFTIEILLSELSPKTRLIAGQLAQVVIDFTSNKYIYRVPIDALVGMDDHGRALIITQSGQDKKLQQQAFDIYKIDNQFIYLLANVSSGPLQIVTQGWQQLTLDGQ